jgi:hypothetical protein
MSSLLTPLDPKRRHCILGATNQLWFLLPNRHLCAYCHEHSGEKALGPLVLVSHYQVCDSLTTDHGFVYNGFRVSLWTENNTIPLLVDLTEDTTVLISTQTTFSFRIENTAPDTCFTVTNRVWNGQPFHYLLDGRDDQVYHYEPVFTYDNLYFESTRWDESKCIECVLTRVRSSSSSSSSPSSLVPQVSYAQYSTLGPPIRFCIRLRCPQPVPELFVDNAIIRVQHQGLLKALNQCTNLTDQILQLQTRLAEAVQDKENLIQVCRNDIALLGGIDTLVEFSDKK